MRKRVILGMASMGYSKGVVALMQLAMVPVLAASWGLALYGQWLVLASVPMFLGASDFGFGVAASNRFIGEIAKDETEEALITFQSAFALISSAAAIVIGAAMACSFLLPSSLFTVAGGLAPAEARLTLALLCLYAAGVLYVPLLVGVARSVGKLAWAIAIGATGQLLEGGGVILVALSGGRAVEAALAMLLGRTVTIIALALVATKVSGWAKITLSHARWPRVKELFRPAVAAMVLPLAQAAFLQGTAMAVGAAGTAAMVPLYTTLRTISRIGLQFMSAIAIPIMPEFAIARAKGEFQLAARIGGALTMGCTAIAIVAAIVLGVFGVEIIRFWTAGVIEPPFLMVLLFAIAIGLDIVWAPLSDLLLAVNRHETYSYIYLGSALVLVFLTFVLVRHFGVVGAASANLALEIIMFSTVMISLRRNFGPFVYGTAVLSSLLPSRFRKSRT